MGRLITDADGETLLQQRNGAILRLLAIYGLRSGEVRRLQVQDVDWVAHRIRIIRSKSGHRDILPLEASVEDAIRCYVRDARRRRAIRRALFLTVNAPFRPLSAGALYDVVASLSAEDRPATDRPWSRHGLRARLRPASDRGGGLSFKEVGDHLGASQSRLDAGSMAKVHLAALRSRGGLEAPRRSPMTLVSAVETYVRLKQIVGAVFSVDARILTATSDAGNPGLSGSRWRGPGDGAVISLCAFLHLRQVAQESTPPSARASFRLVRQTQLLRTIQTPQRAQTGST